MSGLPESETVTPAPPAVSPIVRTVCEPWMFLKRRLLRQRLNRGVFERIAGREFVVWPGVFNPSVFRTGAYLADFVATTALLDPAPGPRRSALDIGTGSGVLAVLAALRGFDVTAVDISPRAASCARANSILNAVDARVRVLVGDLYAPVSPNTFDVVLCSLPKFRGEPRDAFEQTWRSPDVIDRFASGLPRALKTNGVALFVLTSHGDSEGFLSAIAAAGLETERLTWRHFGVETMAIYSARHRRERLIISAHGAAPRLT
jgi:methylase of polypeptide subunit release factors